MKLENIIIENHRQFDKAELSFDQGITILAGANNSGKTSLINLIILEDDTVPSHLMNTTCVKILVSYDPDIDDIKMFADYIMDLDEKVHDFYFLFDYEVTRSKFLRAITDYYDKLKRRFDEIEEDKIKLLSSSDKNRRTI